MKITEAQEKILIKIAKKLQILSKNTDEIYESLEPWEVINNVLIEEVIRLEGINTKKIGVIKND